MSPHTKRDLVAVSGSRRLARRAFSFDLDGGAQEDPYRVLNVKKGASRTAIRRAYLTLAKELHPDRRSNDPEAERRFKAINYAYHALLIAPKPDQKPRGVSLGAWATAVLAFLIPVSGVLIYFFTFSQDVTPQISAPLRLDLGGEPQKVAAADGDIVTGSTIKHAPFEASPREQVAALAPHPEVTNDSDVEFLVSLAEQTSIATVQQYLRLDPVGPHSSRVRKHLRHLIATSQDKQALSGFLNAAAAEDYAESALAIARLKKLNEPVMAMPPATRIFHWAAIRRQFASQQPQPDARAARMAKEHADWRAARALNTRASYAAYQANYPTGRYAAQAKRRAALLDMAANAPHRAKPEAVSAARRQTITGTSAPRWPSADEPLLAR